MSVSADSKSAESEVGNAIFNVPNNLTAARLVLSIVVFALIPLQQYLAALIIFAIAAGTDWMDGWWARRYGQVTKLGRVFDPFVDKIIICGTFVFLAVEMGTAFDPPLPWYATISAWMAVLVLGRELLVTVLRSTIEGSGGDFSAKWSGKWKMVFQCFAAGAGLVVLLYHGRNPDANPVLPVWMFWSLSALVWLTVVSTIYSGVVYVIAAAKMLRN